MFFQIVFKLIQFFLARSPLFGHFSTTLLGLPTIRAFRVQDKFFDILAETQDAHTEAYYAFIGASNWLAFNLDLMSGLLITFCAFICLVFSDSMCFFAFFLVNKILFSHIRIEHSSSTLMLNELVPTKIQRLLKLFKYKSSTLYESILKHYFS